MAGAQFAFRLGPIESRVPTGPAAEPRAGSRAGSAEVAVPRRDRAVGAAVGRTLLLLAAVFALVALVGERAAQVARTGRQILQWKEELRLLEADNRRLEARVIELQSPRRIEAEAKARLGMRPPETIRPVSLPVQPAPAGGGGAAAAGARRAPRTVVVALAPRENASWASGGGARVQAGLDLFSALRGLAMVLGHRTAAR